MMPVDRLNDALSASRPAVPLRRSRRTTDHIGAFLTAAYLAGDEILAGTRAFPGIKPQSQSERHPVQCDQCPATWLFGEPKPEALARLRDHRQERHS